MNKINLGRVLLGGIVAGIVADIIDYPIDGMWLAPRWSATLIHLGVATEFSMNQVLAFDLIGIVGAVVTIWIYAAIRPRFGAGPKTAIYAGLAVWVVGFLLPNISFMYVAHLYSRHLTLYTTLGDLVGCLLGTLVGAALYKEA